MAQMFVDGRINQNGLRKALQVLPVPVPIWLDGMFNRALGATGLPKTRRDATKYSWIED